MIKVAPSLLSADFTRLKDHISEAQAAGADMFHIDIMDGVFVPSLSFGPIVVDAARRSTGLPLGAHLMVSDPTRLIDECIAAGASSVTVHVESTPHVHRLVARIREKGGSPGVALNPGTPLEDIEWVLDDVDSVTVMTVNPGFAGQKFLGNMVPKITRLRQMFLAMGRTVDIVVDGGVNEKTAPLARNAGATILVAGSYVFGSSDMRAAIRSLR